MSKSTAGGAGGSARGGRGGRGGGAAGTGGAEVSATTKASYARTAAALDDNALTKALTDIQTTPPSPQRDAMSQAIWDEIQRRTRQRAGQ